MKNTKFRKIMSHLPWDFCVYIYERDRVKLSSQSQRTLTSGKDWAVCSDGVDGAHRAVPQPGP